MATLRLRDNFAGNSWETGVAPLIQKRGERERVKEERKWKEGREEGEGGEKRQMSPRNRGARSDDKRFCKRKRVRKRPIRDIRFDRYQNFFDNSSKLDKRRPSGYQGRTPSVLRIKRNDGEAIGSKRLKWFY